MVFRINNRDGRRLWLHSQGLSSAPTGALDVLRIIKDLGFVQLDTIRNVSRAHHHILWSRNQNYREPMLDKLLGKERLVFEHYTHDASVLPMEFYPMWKRQFRRMKERIDRRNYYSTMLNEEGREAIKTRIREEGPLSTQAFDTKVTGKKEMWSRPPHKLALDYMWYAGELSTSHRKDFRKFYGLSQDVIPDELRTSDLSDQHQIDWLCNGALDRLAFGTLGDIRRFWEATEVGEVKAWAEEVARKLMSIEFQTKDGSWVEAYAPHDIEQRIADTPDPTNRMRILNPFDPAIRDRTRLERLFGFDYRIEIFVPAAKRKWGYYVYPLLEGDRFVGRIEVKANRKAGVLDVIGFWTEPGVKWTTKRRERLDAELTRLTRLVGVSGVIWADDVERLSD
ncbi:MAG: YcaQ family DNA glycosylase [Rhizobiaceae bacterium]|nr:YcaQ family DNA glycosylase [Rhizobiaceae bacterium]